MSASAEERRERLVELFKEVKDCTRCPLHETRTKAVFGAGNADADLMFVGEAPGAEEDRSGLPFVGRAGQLLNQMLEEIGLARDDVFIANVLKSRPPGNRDPQPEEIQACEPYLFEQVRLIEPRVVCTLGNFATKLLSGSPTGITKVRGTPQVHELGGRTVFLLPLFHPAAALRTPAVKETLRGDFATIPELLQRPLPGPAPSAEEIAEAEAGDDPDPAAARRPARLLRLAAAGSIRWRSSRRAALPRPKLSAPASPSACCRATSSSSPARWGPGKTTLVRGACRALGITDPVTSPTFTIGQRYGGGRMPVSHLDLYRLQTLEGEDPALLEDYLRPEGVAFVEWPAAGVGPIGPSRPRGPPRPRQRGAAADRGRAGRGRDAGGKRTDRRAVVFRRQRAQLVASALGIRLRKARTR